MQGNITPLVDVMLVLLIIFIITAPLLTHAVKVNLPHASSQVSTEDPRTVTLSVDSAGGVYWDSAPIAYGQLFDRMERAARTTPQPALRLRVDRDVRYQRLAEILAAARNAGLTKLSFVTDPSVPPAWTLRSRAGPN